MLGIIISSIALVFILIGVWNEEKLIAFEDRLWEWLKDRTAYCVAQVIIAYRRLAK